MTTTLGAQAGFVALWVIIISCIVKVMVQLEFGKHAINTGETTLQAFSKLPGPKIGRGHWSIWTWFIIKLIQFVQLGGMIGGVALAVNIALPGIPIWILTWIIAFIIIFLVLGGKYSRIEKSAVFLIAIFVCDMYAIHCHILFLLLAST